ncbi:mucolipin-3 [Tetranychus urticae]|uniref:Uncharacterized protein n=1 Tax=Tetranychus urticae TaxID=32264 RepID=T1KFP9_TETUR|nr:mucolipin-3 [Tetranychus urticae]
MDDEVLIETIASTSTNVQLNNPNGDYVDYGGKVFKKADEIEGRPIKSDCDMNEINSFRRQLKYNFMNPIDKWKSKRKFPWKLLLQIIKLLVVTLQIYSFGLEISRYKTHQSNVDITLKELLLADWDPVREVLVYPPGTGPYACYTRDDLDRNINNFVKAFANVTNSSLKTFAYDSSAPDIVSPIYLEIIEFTKGEENAFNFTFNFNNEIHTTNFTIKSDYPAGDVRWDSFSIQNFLSSQQYQFNFDSLIKMKLITNLKIIYRNSLDFYNFPECYIIQISFVLDNSLHAGQVLMKLNTKSIQKQCFGNLEGKSVSTYSVMEVSTVIVMFLTSLSALLCLRSMGKGLALQRKAIVFFAKHYNIELKFHDKMEFIDPWIYLIFINDLLLLTGSSIKLCGGPMDHSQSLANIYSILFGIGILLTWFGVLRYISFFDKFNIVILTMKKAFPDISKFAFCAILLYIGYCLCGWIVLGPHHLKFRTLSSTSECLFALLNGDDLYATFATLDSADPAIWWFSRIFIYSFISLFTYVVLNLFISIVMDAWDIIKNYNSQIQTEMQHFISECNEDVFAEIYQEQPRNSLLQKVGSFFRFNSQDSNPSFF